MDVKPVIRKLSIYLSSPIITWTEPEVDSVTKVYIYSSDDIYGSYTEVANIDATSDGAVKSSSNTWVTSYTDTTGSYTKWYKIRFYDGTNYSNYSDPLTPYDREFLCNVDDIKKVLNTVGRWTDEEIFDEIKNVDENIYDEFGNPLKAVKSPTGYDDSVYQELYYCGEKPIYRVDRVFYGTYTKTEMFLDDDYTVNYKQGMIKVSTTSSNYTMDTSSDIIIDFVPTIFNTLAKYRVAYNLLEKIDTVNGGDVSKELAVIEKHLNKVEIVIANRYTVALSSDFKYYDKNYGVNMVDFVQDFDKNKYIATSSDNGWL